MVESTIIDAQAIGRLLCDPHLGGQRIEINAGDVLHDVDTPAEYVYFVNRGQFRVYQLGTQAQNDTRLAGIFGAEQWFGIAGIAGRLTYGFRTVAGTNSVVTAVPVARFLAAVGQDPILSKQFAQELATRLMETYDACARQVFDDCNGRLLKTLLSLTNSAVATPKGEEIELRITHQQLAQAVGAARETISLALTELRLQNLVQTGRNRLMFNPRALEEFSRTRGTATKAVELQPQVAA